MECVVGGRYLVLVAETQSASQNWQQSDIKLQTDIKLTSMFDNKVSPVFGEIKNYFLRKTHLSEYLKTSFIYVPLIFCSIVV